jgi:GMP synthase (glutamine-hydrolysing)
VKVLVLRNNIHEGPGILTGILENREISSDIVDFEGEGSLPSLSAYSAVVMLGGPESANDRTKKMLGEIAFVRTIIRAGIPYFGICLGMQVLVRAAGGRVTTCAKKEIGWRDEEGEYHCMQVTGTGRNDPLFKGLPGTIRVFQLHEEMVEPSICGDVLAFGDQCPVQVVKEGIAVYGIQGHIEIDEALLGTLLRTDPALSSLDGGRIISDFNEIREDYNACGSRLLSNFLDIAEET